MTTLDLLYDELMKYKKRFNVARIITLIFVFIPFIIGYIHKQMVWVGVSISILVIMITFIGIPILKKIGKLKKEIEIEEERNNYAKQN